MATAKNKNKDIRLSKSIYLSTKKTLMNLLDMSEDDLMSLVNSMSDSNSFQTALFNTTDFDKVSGRLAEFGLERFTDLVDNVYYYKRMLHFEVESELEPKDSIDLTGLSKVEKEFTIDFTYKSNRYCIQVFHRNYPVHNISGSKTYDWSCIVWGEELRDPTNATYEVSPRYGIHFNIDKDVKRVLIGSVMGKARCLDCTRCNTSQFICGDKVDIKVLKIHPLHNRDNCNLTVSPVMVLSILQHVLDVYNSRAVLTKNNSISRKYKANKVHTIRTDEYTDTEVKLPLHMSVEGYNPSVKREYKGGHHRSPVTHYRKGYFRKSKAGDYIIKDGMFINVPKGTGTHTYVKGSQINMRSEADLLYKIK